MVDTVRTWDRQGQELTPALTTVLACGCVRDLLLGGIWRPCMAHESDGHLAVVSEQDDLAVARCLVLRCAWQETHSTQTWAVVAAQAHWQETRHRT